MWTGEPADLMALATSFRPLPVTTDTTVASWGMSPSSQAFFSAEQETGRSGYYAAAWISLLFCLPLTIVFNLMDNSVSKSKGLPPTFAPTIVAIVLWVLFAAAFYYSGVYGF